MTQVTANLAAFNGQIARLRWQEGDDSSVQDIGWFVDSVTVNNAALPTVCVTGGLFYSGFETGILVPPWAGASP